MLFLMKSILKALLEHWMNRRKQAHEEIKKIAISLVEGMGGKCNFELRKGYPVFVNEKALRETTCLHAEEYLGKENIVNLAPWMAAEDFAYYAQTCPTCFYRLGR